MMTARLRVRYSLRTWWLRIFRPKKFKRLTRFYSVLVDSDWIGGDDGAHRPQPQGAPAVEGGGVMDERFELWAIEDGSVKAEVFDASWMTLKQWRTQYRDLLYEEEEWE